jgi:hypothetical protein
MKYNGFVGCNLHNLHKPLIKDAFEDNYAAIWVTLMLNN